MNMKEFSEKINNIIQEAGNDTEAEGITVTEMIGVLEMTKWYLANYVNEQLKKKLSKQYQMRDIK